MVQEIQTEHEKVLRKTDYLLFVERQEIDVRQRMEVMRIALVIAKDALLLQDIGRRHLLDHRITVPIAGALHLQCAVDQEEEVSARIARLDDLPSSGNLLETETGMSGYNLQIVTAHALK